MQAVSAAVQNLGYTWDKVGNLMQRRDVNASLTEDFTYDELNRLKTSKLNTVSNLSLTYYANGNIQNKSDVGNYAYPTQGAGAVRPHAVSTAGSGHAYSYDANGNMTLRDGSVIAWTSYNLPSSIAQGGNTATFLYGAGRARYKQIAVTTGGPLPAGTETTVYIGGLFEKVTKPSGVVEYKHYVLAGKEPVAIKTVRSNLTSDVRYMHKDHLGGLHVLTNEAGTAVLRLSNDAFGKRRSGSTWSGSPCWSGIAALTHLNFTGHESLDNVELIHMNGRVYDPMLGRFISADPMIQAPLMSQSLNRYSYVMNNPLSLVDPSGFFFKKLFRSIGHFLKKWGATIVGIGLSFVPGLNFLAASFISSFVNSALNGGNFFQSLALGIVTGAIGGGIAGNVIKFGGLAGQIARGVLGGGIAGGLTSAAHGGSFWDGFAQGAAVGGAVAGITYGIQRGLDARQAKSWGPNGEGLYASTGDMPEVIVRASRMSLWDKFLYDTAAAASLHVGRYADGKQNVLNFGAGAMAGGAVVFGAAGASHAFGALATFEGGGLILGAAAASDVAGLAIVGTSLGAAAGVALTVAFGTGYLLGTGIYNGFTKLYY